MRMPLNCPPHQGVIVRDIYPNSPAAAAGFSLATVSCRWQGRGSPIGSSCNSKWPGSSH